MKLLPVYLNCVLKSDVLQPGAEVTTDDRAYVRQLVTSMDVAETNVFFYPRLLPMVRLRVGVWDTTLSKSPLRRMCVERVNIICLTEKNLFSCTFHTELLRPQRAWYLGFSFLRVCVCTLWGQSCLMVLWWSFAPLLLSRQSLPLRVPLNNQQFEHLKSV
jgi:hypothetical protein